MLDLSTGLVVVAFLLAWVSFGLLALAQERHSGQFYPSFRPPGQSLRARAALKIIAIVLTLSLCIKAQGAGFGSLLWVLLISLAAMTTALQLTWAPRTLKPLAWLIQRLFKRHFDGSFPINAPR